MRILVLDTIHGGAELARALRGSGYQVDEVDVYRGKAGIPVEEALVRSYDLVTAPVHLDPDHPLLQQHGPAVSHHETVGRVIRGRRTPAPFHRDHWSAGEDHHCPRSRLIAAGSGYPAYLYRDLPLPGTGAPLEAEHHACLSDPCSA